MVSRQPPVTQEMTETPRARVDLVMTVDAPYWGVGVSVRKSVFDDNGLDKTDSPVERAANAAADPGD